MLALAISLLEILGGAMIVAGTLIVLIGALGLLRLPDVFARLHGAGMTDTLASALILLGLMIYAGPTLTAAKLALIGLFLFFTSPTATHALANAAFTGQKPSDVKPSESDAMMNGKEARDE
jgi:multicomponent Na+:H+ antiporter subunit G